VIRLGLVGFGTVGQALVRLIQSGDARLSERLGVRLAVTAIGNRGIDRKKADWVKGPVRWTEDLESVVTDPAVEVVVELMGGIDPAGALITKALGAGKSVVTANKLLLSAHGFELAALAAAKGAGMGIEAAVAGGIPILRAIRESFAGDRLLSVEGILNGTCNFILTEMERTGRSYPDVLAEAQKLGYAEADPASDVEGADAGYKLVLLARMAFGQKAEFGSLFREGITGLLPCDFVYAKLLQRTPRQLASARLLPNGRLALSVRTHMVSLSSMLAKVTGPFNAVQVRGEKGGDFVFSGRGAGGDPTAVAVLSDIIELARSGPRPLVPPLGFPAFEPFSPAGPEEFSAPFYLRFVVRDKAGIIAGISQVLAKHQANIEAVFQAPYGERDALPFVITLETVSQAQVAKALEEIAALDFHVVPPVAFPLTD
jgi:homoserine dehydrogenase